MRWPCVPLGETVERVPRPVPIDPDSDYRLLGMRSNIGGPFLRERKKGAEISASKLYRVESGDFIYSRLFAWQGSFGVIPDSLDGCHVSNEFPTFRVDRTRLDPRFLVLWFGLLQTQREVEADCFGSTPGTRNRYREKYFLRLRAPLPGVDVQQRIINRIDRVAELLDTRKQIVDRIERSIQATGSNTLREIICGSPHRPLGEVAPLVRRRVFVHPDHEYTEIGVKSFYKGVFHRRTMIGAEYNWQKLHLIRRGDLIFSNLMAWEKAIAVASMDDDGCVGNHRMLTCEVDQAMATPGFLLSYFKTAEGFASVVGH